MSGPAPDERRSLPGPISKEYPILKPTFSLNHILPLVQKPGRYLGTEFHAVYKDPDAVRLRAALIFPDLYEIGMSHLGLELLYHILNQNEDVWAERVYAPALDLEKALRERQQPLASLESGTPLHAFDLLGISLQYELSYTNLLTILELGGVSVLASSRRSEEPVVIGGGPICCNPESVAPFFDAILIGDGEEAIVEIAHLVRDWRETKGSRRELYQALEMVEGVYVPSLFEMEFDREGHLREIIPLGRRQRIRRRVVSDLNTQALFPKPLVPQVQIVHDRLNVEICRGCTRGCRFCQAGIIYRPVRERAPETIVAWAEEALMASGFEEISLLSLSTGDYSCLSPLLTCLMDRLEKRRIALSLPSMRADTLRGNLMEQIKRVRKTGFTIAPEAGSERMRRAINKNLTEAEILGTIRQAFELGWNLLKLYFMIGFPMEEMADIQALADLCRQALAVAKEVNRKARLHVSINTFIPKPHTPFQWERQLSREESQERLHLAKSLLKQKGIEIKWNPSSQSWLEGILARGDRRLAPVLLEAQRLGCRFDAWTEHARIGKWQQAFSTCGVQEDFYLRERREDELLPWDHIEVGVLREYLVAERHCAREAVQTPDCRSEGCLNCGVCDWVKVQPQMYKVMGEPQTIYTPEVTEMSNVTHYRLYYSKLARAKWLGHRELMNIFYRSLRRSGLRLHFSQGFHPLPKVSFHGALPVGVESLMEIMDIELEQEYSHLEVLARLNDVLPSGIHIDGAERLSANNTSPSTFDRHLYEVNLPAAQFSPEKIENFINSTEFAALRKKPKETKTIDIRPLVSTIHQRDLSTLEILINTREKDNLKINDLVTAIFDLTEAEAVQLKTVKHKSYSSH
jgi:radical SAM family uncharacterized protein/radical SAM-linked protein